MLFGNEHRFTAARMAGHALSLSTGKTDIRHTQPSMPDGSPAILISSMSKKEKYLQASTVAWCSRHVHIQEPQHSRVVVIGCTL